MFTWAKIVSGLVSLANAVVSAFQRKQDRDAGAAAQVLVDKTAEVEADQNALKAANNTTAQSVADSLRNDRF